MPFGNFMVHYKYKHEITNLQNKENEIMKMERSMLERRDNTIGRVTRVLGKKCLVELDDVDCTAYYFGNGTVGDKVLLSVIRNLEEEQDIKCALDSVLEYAPLKAG